MMETPVLTLETERLQLRLPIEEDAPRLLEYRLCNREAHAATNPLLPRNFYTIEFWQEQQRITLEEFEKDTAVRFLLLRKEAPEAMIGHINFTQIFRGPFQACYVGYSLSGDQQGNGYMTEALREAVRYMFEDKNIHRIMANYLPENERSARVLDRLGFVREGIAKEYLHIGGEWRDHILTSLTNRNWKEKERP